MSHKKKKNQLVIKGLEALLLMAASVFWIFVFSIQNHSGMRETIYDSVISFTGALFILFTYFFLTPKMVKNRGFDKIYFAFIIFCVVFMGLWCVEPVVPFLTIPFSVIGIILLLHSNVVTAVYSYCYFLTMMAMLDRLTMGQFLLLFLTGLCGIVSFSVMNREYRYAGSLAAYICFLMIAQISYAFLDEETLANSDTFLYIAIQLFAAFVLVLAILKIFGKIHIYSDLSVFEKMNDPEYELLAQLKKIDKKAYFHAVHTAYFADKAARKIGADHMLAKAGGYYHRIGLIQGQDTIQNTLLVGTSCKFPVSLMDLLKEYGTKIGTQLSKEAAIVQIADAVVSSISYLFEKNDSLQVNYEQVVDVIIRKKMDKGDFSYCELSLKDLQQIKLMFKEERLYYDFLR